MSNVKCPSIPAAALAADAALAAYLRTLADRQAAELNADAPRSSVARWSVAPLSRAHYQRVIPLREARLERLALSSRAEPRAAQRRGAR